MSILYAYTYLYLYFGNPNTCIHTVQLKIQYRVYVQKKCIYTLSLLKGNKYIHTV